MSGESPLSRDEVIERVKATFAPYRVEIDIADFQIELKFTVHDDDTGRWVSHRMHKQDIDFTMASLLDQTLQQGRDELRRSWGN